MTCARLFASLAILFSTVLSSALACSSTSRPPADADAGPDARLESGAEDVARREARTSDAPFDSNVEGGAPVLVQLAIEAESGDAAAAFFLQPPFSPTTYDYYVRCSSAPTSVEVSIAASSGATSSLVQPVTSKEVPAQKVSVELSEDEAVVAVAKSGTATTEYWVRCLPHDFPNLHWIRTADAGSTTPGYYLVGGIHMMPSAGFAIVLDDNGVPVWYRRAPPANGVYNVDNVVDGAISYMSFPTVHPYQVDHLGPWSSVALQPIGLYDNEHELRALPNGDFIVLSYIFETGVNLTGVKLPLADGGVASLGASSDIQDCEVVEFDPAGNVVWSWLATDHLDPVVDSTWPQVSTALLPAADGGTVYDLFHCNSVDVEPTTGDLLVSARHMDSVFYIQKSSKKILWKMGGSPYTKDDAVYVPVADPFYRQHDARFQGPWTPSCTGGSGKISVFDDETARPGPARAVVYDVQTSWSGDGGAAADCGAAMGGGDAGAPPATVAWQYKAAASSVSLGSFRIASDGTRLICWGGLTGAPAFTEIDMAGHKLLEFRFNNESYRAIKVPLAAFDRSVLRSATAHP